jgi:hypothetical protein
MTPGDHRREADENGGTVYRSMGFEPIGGYIEHARPKA